jgi:hypothetical protein
VKQRSAFRLEGVRSLVWGQALPNYAEHSVNVGHSARFRSTEQAVSLGDKVSPFLTDKEWEGFRSRSSFRPTNQEYHCSETHLIDMFARAVEPCLDVHQLSREDSVVPVSRVDGRQISLMYDLASAHVKDDLVPKSSVTGVCK